MGADDIAKLPVWARHLIEKLEGDVSYYKRQAAEVLGDVESPVRVRLSYQNEVGLPRGASVLFTVDGQRIEVGLNHNNELEVYAIGSGSLVIKPIAGNVVRIMFADS